jgi:hypothetical protein
VRVSERTQAYRKHGSFCNKCEAGGAQFHSLRAMANWGVTRAVSLPALARPTQEQGRRVGND